MKDINQITLLGMLYRDPEYKHTPKGKRLAKLTLMTNEGYRADNEWKTVSTYHDITVWDNLVLELETRGAKQGTRLFIQGKISKRKFEDKYYVEVIASHVAVLTDEVRVDEKVTDEIDFSEIPF